MLRFWFLIVFGFISACISIYRLSKCATDENCTEEQRYSEAVKVVSLIMKKGKIKTEVYGTENLPEENGYIMYSNHQGKYDALGIIHGHKKPLSVLMDDEKSHSLLVSQFIDALKGKRIEKNNPKQQIGVLNEIAAEVKEGRRYLIFPEGGYTDNKNRLQKFLFGCFKCAKRAECPIIPVCIIDSWKPFGMNSLKKVVTQVYFLAPITFEEYGKKKPHEIAELVKKKISEKLIEVVGEA